jgi:outer membrane lipoprotein SlyB
MTRETLATAAVLAILAFANPREARAQDVQEAIKELGLTVTPAKDQTAEQQKADEQACAEETVNSLDTPEIQEAKQEGGAGKGAVKGAAGGLLIGAITGDAGKGAAIGAGVGAAGGAVKKNKSEKNADKANAEASEKVKKDATTKMTSCLSKKGYSVVGS